MAWSIAGINGKKVVRRFLKFSEKQTVKYGDIIIADNKEITDYVKTEYGKESKLIAYGGREHVVQNISSEESDEILKKYELTSSPPMRFYSLLPSGCAIVPA